MSFGTGPFGSGPFGSADWAEHVLWEDLPQLDRSEDAAGDGSLRKFINAVKPMFEGFKALGDDWLSLRDPEEVRTRYQDNVTVALDPTTFVTGDGVVTVGVLPGVDPVVELLAGVSAGWILRDVGRQEFVVNAVDKLGATLELEGTQLPDGTASVVLRPPSLIERLGADYGIEVDSYEPEGFQRSSVQNAVEWLGLKGTPTSYDVLGKISGYRATAIQLWRIPSSIVGSMPVGHVFEIPASSGRYYTDLPAMGFSTEDVAADAVEGLAAGASVTDLYSWQEVSVGGVLTGVESLLRRAVTVTAVALVDLASGRYRLTATGPMWRQVSAGTWYVEMPSGRRLAVETIPELVSGSTYRFEVVMGPGLAGPATGAMVHGAWPTLQISAEYCPASVIELEIVPAEVLGDPEALQGDALGRMLTKIQQVVPIHVRELEATYLIEAAVSLGLTVADSQESLTDAVASVTTYFDDVPADGLTLDGDSVEPDDTITITGP
jgi:hypothetical protein